MITIFCLIARAVISGARTDNDMPLAPYNLQLYCRNGQSHIPETRILSLCPSSSTSCGYFEFETLSSPGSTEAPLGIYECIDSSILMSDNDDDEDEKQLLFSKYCDDQARCRNIMLSAFNIKFVQYLARRERVKLQKLLATRVKFCCAVNDQLLQKIIHSDDYVLPTAAPEEPIVCNGIRCKGAPIGCLTYTRHNETEHSEEEDVIFVQPVHFNYEDYTVLPPQPVNNKYLTKYTAEHHCVYRHFNDELYRYCLLVHDHSSSDHCFDGEGYQICCCFLHRGARTCDPLSTGVEPSTTTEAAEVTSTVSTVALRAYITNAGARLRTRCRTVYEMHPEFGASASARSRQRQKKLLCDTDVISASHSYTLYFNFLLLTFCCFVTVYLRKFIVL